MSFFPALRIHLRNSWRVLPRGFQIHINFYKTYKNVWKLIKVYLLIYIHFKNLVPTKSNLSEIRYLKWSRQKKKILQQKFKID